MRFELDSVAFEPIRDPDPGEPPSYFEGRLPTPGFTVVLGRNTSGKTAMLEAIEQALINDWFGEERTRRRSYRPQLSQFVKFRLRMSPQDAESLIGQLKGEEPDSSSDLATSWHGIDEPAAAGLEVTLFESGAEVDAWWEDQEPQPVWFSPGVDFEELRPWLPRPVVLAAEVPDMEAFATAIVRQLPGSRTPDYWDRTTMAPMVDPASGIQPPREFTEQLEHLGRVATSYLPDFLHDLNIVLGLADVNLLIHGGSPVQVRLEQQDGSLLHPDQLGAGARRWLAAAVQVASIDIHRGSGLPQPVLLLVDEPELHLHPRAISSVADWLVTRSTDQDILGVIVATHSPTLLRPPTPGAATVLLDRGDFTRIHDLTDDLMGALEHYSFESGFELSVWFNVVRGVLLVEGEHDKAVVERFFGDELSRHRVFVLPVRGHRNVTHVAQTEFLGYLGVPIFVLLDNVNAALVESAEAGDHLRDEDSTAFTILKLREKEMDVHLLPYDEPDILCALPPATISRRYSHLSQLAEDMEEQAPYWGAWISDWRNEISEQGRRSFKAWVADRMGLSKPSRLLPELLEQVRPGDRPSPALTRAVKTMTAQLP